VPPDALVRSSRKRSNTILRSDGVACFATVAFACSHCSAAGLRFQLALARGDNAAAIRELTWLRQGEENAADRLMNDCVEAALRGNREWFEDLVPQLKAEASPDHWAYLLAGMYARLGDLTKSFEYLNEAFSRKATSFRWWRLEPFYTALRADPRWTELTQRYGLPP